MRNRLPVFFLFLVWMIGVWFWIDSAQKKQMAMENRPAPTSQSYQDFFSQHFLPLLPVTDGFDFPLRPPNGRGAYVIRPFGADHHLGENWKTAPGDRDLGEPVYSVADGWVSMAMDFESSWGKVVFIVYRLPEGRWPPVVEVMYAHLKTMEVQPYVFVKRGQKIGTMGNVDGLYKSHLHWEVRQSVGLGLGGAYADKPDGFLDPSAFILAHRPRGATAPEMKSILRKEWPKWGGDD